MIEIKNIFSQIDRGGEGEAFVAARIIGVVNQVLIEIGKIPPQDARAISYQRGTVTISTSHGAIAEKIAINQPAWLEIINNKIKLTGAGKQAVQKLVTRQN